MVICYTYIPQKGSTTFSDEPVDTHMNYLHIFYINMLDDENKLLLNALDKTSYRKIAKECTTGKTLEMIYQGLIIKRSRKLSLYLLERIIDPKTKSIRWKYGSIEFFSLIKFLLGC